jgi:hypothetical protein
MFGLWTRSFRTRKPSARRTTTLCLEKLEDRLSPATSSGGVTGSAEYITLDVTYLQGQQATFSGQLTNASGNPVAGQTIDLTGVVNATTTTDSQGDYSITLKVPQLGTEYAASADGLSNTAQYTLVGGSPVISDFMGVAENGGLWLFSGTVSGAPTQGEVVNFGGIIPLQGTSTTVNSDGTFDFYAIVPSGEGGWATAQAVDWWGDTSPIVSTYVNA